MQALPVLSTDTIDDNEVRHWPLSYLRHLHIEMGQQCNVRCSMCYQTDFSPATKLPDVVWRDHLAPAYEHIKSITMQGGEPTILPNCRELLTIIYRDYPHIQLDTVTNGVLWKGLWEEAFLKQGSCVNFSLNAVDPQLYEKIVQFGRQQDVLENIHRMIRRRREMGSKVVIRISSVVLPETIDELPRFYQWGVDNGLDQVLFHTDSFLSAKHPDIQFVQKKLAETYELAAKNPNVKLLHLNEFDWLYAKLHHVQPIQSKSTAPADFKPCPIAFDNLFVSYQGTARPCCKSWYPLGDLVKDSIEVVWNSHHAHLFRKRMLNMDFRDCMVACDLNVNPIEPKMANARKAFWVFRRDPKGAYTKTLRKLGFNNAQVELPVLQK